MIGIESDFENIFKFCEEYPDTGHGIPVGDPEVAKCIGSLERIGKTVQAELGMQDWSFKVAKGAGAFPRIPWIVFGPKPIVKIAPSKGMYLCIAISEDGSGFVAGLNVATAEKKQWQDRLSKVPKAWKLKIDGTKRNTKYSDGFFNPQPFYRKDWQPSELINHLRESADLLLSLGEPPKEPSKQKMYQLKQQLTPSLQYSLLSKPFVILTGASGTGKTKLAESIAAYLSDDGGTNSAVVPVGADWTDNRPVLGFVNHLRTVKDGRPVFQSTPIVDLLLKASENLDVPHFLILDEMNLSHVERYFADFLSAMEQDEGVLRFHEEGAEEDFRLPRFEGDGGVPQSIPYPKNLFVIGTVNIDETTYMFSPKVLDRANVIEFTVKKEEIEDFLNDPHPYPKAERAEDGVAEGFLKLAEDARSGSLAKLDAKPKEAAAGHLTALFVILKAGRFEFAYRTANEVMRYLGVCSHLAGDEEERKKWNEAKSDKDENPTGWQSDLDDQILQKLLPKLHGSIGRVGGLLAELAHYCKDGKPKDESVKLPTGTSALQQAAELDETGAAFPKSLKKLKAMIQTLRDEQFVSFIQ